MSSTSLARDGLPSVGAHARRLERHVADWAEALPSDGIDMLAVEPLHGGVAHFCRAMHALGVHGPYVRRVVGQVMQDALIERVPCSRLRERAAREARGMVDVIYLQGEHR